MVAVGTVKGAIHTLQRLYSWCRINLQIFCFVSLHLLNTTRLVSIESQPKKSCFADVGGDGNK